MEGRTQHAIGQLRPGRLVRPDRQQPAGRGLWQHGVGRNGNCGRVRDSRWPRGFAPLDDRLGENGKADEGVDDHQCRERNLRAECGPARFKRPHRDRVREVDGDDVADEHGRNCRIPGEAGADDGDVDPVARGPEQIPAPAEGVGQKWDDVLAVDRSPACVEVAIASQWASSQ